jgi:hypothetical protein
MTFKLYYLQGKGLLQAFRNENDQDPSSLAVREALKQAGFKVRVSVQEFDQNKQPVGEPRSKEFELRVTGETAEFVGDSKTAIFVDLTPREKSFYTITIDAPAVSGGESVLEPVVLQKLHIEKMDISVVMPVASNRAPPSDLIPPCEAYPMPMCEAYRRPCRLFGGWRRCKCR